MPSVLIPLAEGFEEIEAITVIDLLRRADIEVVVAGLEDGPVTASRGTRVLPDTTLDAALASDYDMLVLPGGPGAARLGEDERVAQVLKKVVESGKFAGAICAAPKVLADCGLLTGRRATGYPGFIDQGNYDLTYTGAAVEIDGRIVTSRGPGTAMDFGLALIEQLVGAEARQNVEARLVRA